MTTNKNNGKKPEETSWLYLQEILHLREYQVSILKAWEEARPPKLIKFRSGTTMVFGTKSKQDE